MSLAETHFRTVTLFADTISAGAIVGAFMGILPPIAALAATVWYGVQIWESHTVQKWWRLHKRHRRTVGDTHTRRLRRRRAARLV